MKLSEHIKQLQLFLETHGDMDAFAAVDDEGNGYNEVNYSPSMFYRYKHSGTHYCDLMLEGDIEEFDYEKDDCIPVCVVN